MWTDAAAREWIREPVAGDDKYSRGVLGIVTGSDEFPGAAVLSVEGAARAGAGMLRYLGEERPTDLVLQRRPEVVTAKGRVQAWLVGSGLQLDSLSADRRDLIAGAVGSGQPVVVDAGALPLVARGGNGMATITPHYRELAALLDAAGVRADAAAVQKDPGTWAERAVDALGVNVLLKGSTTHVASVDGERYTVSGAPAWLATAGTGDVLGGILGSMLASHAENPEAKPARIAATAALVHARAASRALRGGPITALDVAEAVPGAISALLAA